MIPAESRDFYLKEFPVLNMSGWEECGHHKSYGTVWWVNHVATETPQISAALYLHVGNGWARIDLRVRHDIHGAATTRIRAGDDRTPGALLRATRSNLPRLIADVQKQYAAWSDEAAKMYPRENQHTPTHNYDL